MKISIIRSFEKNPDIPGKPINDNPATVNVTNVIGMENLSPPILLIFCSWWHFKMIEPAHRNKSALNLILNEFKKCGYDVFHKLLNAYDFGLPQNRDRLFIVGIQKKYNAYLCVILIYI